MYYLFCHVGKCYNPLNLADVIIEGYEDPALEGASITFTCLEGMTLSGPNSSTCMGNGEWEPAITEVECANLVTTGTTMLCRSQRFTVSHK